MRTVDVQASKYIAGDRNEMRRCALGGRGFSQGLGRPHRRAVSAAVWNGSTGKKRRSAGEATAERRIQPSHPVDGPGDAAQRLLAAIAEGEHRNVICRYDTTAYLGRMTGAPVRREASRTSVG